MQDLLPGLYLPGEVPMFLPLAITRLARLGLLTALLPTAGLAAEALSNSSLSETWVTDAAAPAQRCKQAPADDAKAPCPPQASTSPLLNPDQDAVVRRALAEDSPHAVNVDTIPPESRQVLQNIENSFFGNTVATPSGGLSYTSYGLGPGMGSHDH